MPNKRSIIGFYRIASVLYRMKIGSTMTDIFRQVNINHESIDYNFLRSIVDELEGKNYIKTDRNGGKSRVVTYVDLEIKKKAKEFLDMYSEFSELFKT